MTFTIPWVPPMLNRMLRSHWRERGRVMKVAGGYILSKLGKNHDVAPERVRVTIQMYRKNPVDRDGLAGCKPIFDCLVKFGWAKDDCEKHMEQIIKPVIVDRKNPPRTVITLEAL